ncbi:hypothetical protein [Trinickia fusca]|uniref:Type III secretion protein HrpB2 n=1 Tax=Trinickia fusca TaxID=2419777 RepID=A0A494X8R5_9BURK|nr:hypothetical protein [Trinickia fusca]RKP44564.1 hypothetical protein D7S89_22045 [Trinickia fusca]
MDSAWMSAHLQQMFAQEVVGTGTSAHSTASAPETQQLADKFQALYEHGRAAAPQSNGMDTETMISKVVHDQDVMTRAVSNDAMFMMHSMPHMSMQQSFAAQTQVMLEASGLECDMQVKLAVVTSTKDAIGTLMRNQ